MSDYECQIGSECENGIESDNESDSKNDDSRYQTDSDSDSDIDYNGYPNNNTDDSDNIEEENVDSEDFIKSQIMLHPNLKITRDDFMNLILIFFLRHNLTWVALENLLLMLKTILQVNDIPSNKYGFLKYFKNTYKSYLHYYCGSCNIYFGLKIPENWKCHSCEVNINKKDLAFFIYIPIEQQIKNTLEKNKKYFIENWLCAENQISDVFDGKIHKNISQFIEGSDKLVTLTFNTDGGCF